MPTLLSLAGDGNGNTARKIIWAVKPFEMTMDSPEAKELLECSFDFALGSLKRGYKKFATAIAPVIATLAEQRLAHANMSPERTAHVLAKCCPRVQTDGG